MRLENFLAYYYYSFGFFGRIQDYPKPYGVKLMRWGLFLFVMVCRRGCLLGLVTVYRIDTMRLLLCGLTTAFPQHQRFVGQ